MTAQLVDENHRLCSVSAEPRQVFDDYRVDRFLIELLIDFLNAFALEGHSADVIIKGFSDDLMIACFCVLY